MTSDDLLIASLIRWVTIATNGKLLVTPQRQLDAGARQRHMVAWARRRAVDKTMASWGQGQEGKKRGDDTGGAKQAKVQLPSRWKLGVFWSEVGSPFITSDCPLSAPLTALRWPSECPPIASELPLSGLR